MKVSNYVIEMEIDKHKKLLYSTVSRKYHVFEKKQEKQMKALFEDLGRMSSLSRIAFWHWKVSFSNM